MNIALLIILGIVIILCLSDDGPEFYTWLKRIKIGRLKQNWQSKVKAKALLWLNKTPKIPIKDQRRRIWLEWVKNKYYSNTIQSWQQASLLLGLKVNYENTQDQKVKKEMLTFYNKTIDEQGHWINPSQEVDAALLAFALSETPFIEISKIKPALESTYQLLSSKIGDDGTIMYRTSTQNYRYVDTIGFVAPFLVKYGLLFNSDEAISLAINQIKTFETYGVLKNKIPCHAYDIHTKNPVGIYGWARGMAWWVLGTLETYKALPDNHSEKEYLNILLSQITETLLILQKEDGSFSWNLFMLEDRSDSSATAVFAWLFKERKEIKASQKALQYLQSVTRRDGAVDFSQGDTKGLGVYAQEFNILPFTQGFLLRAIQ